jgi:hypothetical protein
MVFNERSMIALFFSSSILFLKYTSDDEFLALLSCSNKLYVPLFPILAVLPINYRNCK